MKVLHQIFAGDFLTLFGTATLRSCLHECLQLLLRKSFYKTPQRIFFILLSALNFIRRSLILKAQLVIYQLQLICCTFKTTGIILELVFRREPMQFLAIRFDVTSCILQLMSLTSIFSLSSNSCYFRLKEVNKEKSN